MWVDWKASAMAVKWASKLAESTARHWAETMACSREWQMGSHLVQQKEYLTGVEKAAL